jgi:hypothetical protein
MLSAGVRGRAIARGGCRMKPRKKAAAAIITIISDGPHAGGVLPIAAGTYLAAFGFGWI